MPPLRSRDIRTNQMDVSCDVCGRTLLRGERAEPFLAGGARRQVCELCTARAMHEGWIHESGADDLGVRSTRPDGRGRSLIGRLRQRRLPARELDGDGAVEEEPPVVLPAAPAPPLPTPRHERHVHAVPTTAEVKMQRALQVFNGSHHTRTVAGVARSLGMPEVAVRTSETQPSVVTITVMWELSWYRFEVDLSDEAGGARRADQGAELSELDEGERVPNAAADERGALALAE